MSYDQIAFIYYNPKTDTKLCPKDGNTAYENPALSLALFDTVRRMKRLIGKLTLDDLNNTLPDLRKYIEFGYLKLLNEPNPLYEGASYEIVDDASSLIGYIEYNDHGKSLEQCAELFGVLAAAYIGTAYNILWPGEEILAESGKIAELLYASGVNQPSSNAAYEINELLFPAVRAVACGEQYLIRAAYGKDKAISEKNSANAKQKDKVKKQIFEAYIQWALSLPKEHDFIFESEAIHNFTTYQLQDQQKLFLTNTLLTKTLPKKLKDHCKRENILHPFK